MESIEFNEIKQSILKALKNPLYTTVDPVIALQITSDSTKPTRIDFDYEYIPVDRNNLNGTIERFVDAVSASGGVISKTLLPDQAVFELRYGRNHEVSERAFLTWRRLD